MRNYRLVATSLVATALTAFGYCVPQAQAEESARLITYQHQGKTFYALSLTADAEVQKSDASSIVVLFDTSASQQGAYRKVALAALESLVDNLRPSDRLQLLAVDLGVQPLTEGFVAPKSPEFSKSLSQLSEQVPLGSTDLVAALNAAMDRLALSSVGPRSVFYIGDGISIANLLDTATMRSLVDDLRQAQVSVHSLAIGPKVDVKLLAVLANHTGGNLYVQEPMVWRDEEAGISDQRAQEENLRNAQVAGKYLAEWLQATVLWPKRAQLPGNFGQTYPASMPPLRTDRDTILVGVTSDTLDAAMNVTIDAVNHNGSVATTWSVTPESSLEDHAFLAHIVDGATLDDGLSLPTVGSAGLAETARLIGAQMDQLTQLADRAFAAGDHKSAHRIVQTVLRADPGNVKARTVQNVVEELGHFDELGTPVGEFVQLVAPQDLGSQEVGPQTVEGEVTLAQRQPLGAAPPVEEGLLDEFRRDGNFLDQVEQERRVYEEMLSKEIQNTIIQSRTNMSSNPQIAIQDLKLALENVQRAGDLAAPKREELVDQLRSVLKEVRYQAALKDELDRQREEELASSRERKLVNERLSRDMETEKQLIAKFNALIDDRQYLDAEEVAQIAEEVDPNGVTPRVATLYSRQKRHHYLQQVARTARHKATFDTLYQHELSAIPFPDVPPIVYPDAEIWEELTNRRKG